jgi:mono/diheme cytochrome c family protein
VVSTQTSSCLTIDERHTHTRLEEDPVRKDWSAATFEGVFMVTILAVAGAAGLIGWFVGHEMGSASSNGVTSSTATEQSAPGGHAGGANLAVADIGNATRGAQLFDSKGCSDCHSFNGQGGNDAPPLDGMMGHLSASEVASMSGDIWNHLPQMIHHFEEEGIAVPTFSGNEMADLIAYLHGGAPAGMSTNPSGGTGMSTGMGMGTGSP